MNLKTGTRSAIFAGVYRGGFLKDGRGRLLTSFGAALFCCLAASAQPAPRQFLRGHVPAVVSRLAAIGNLPATNQLALAIGLPLQNQAGLDELLRELYDPASANFHKFLTPVELAARFGPTEQDYAAVRQFVESNGLAVVHEYPNRVVLDVSGSVANIERAFQVTLRTYRHPVEPRNFYAPDREPSVPASSKMVSIEGLDNFSLPRPAGLKVNALSFRPLSMSGTGPNHEYMGNDFRNAYVPGTALNGTGQTVALLEYSDYFKVDITNYENAIGILNYVPLTNVIVGGSTPGTANNDEVALDIEMAIAMAPKLSRVIVYEESSANSSVLSQIQSDNLARQVSSSWSVGNWSSSLATTFDNILKLMAAQGQSYFQSSGDSDAYTGTQLLDNGVTVPLDSPYATIVGGTSLTTSSYGGAWSSETVWNYTTEPNVGSGGGISAYYAQPSWQTSISMASNGGSTTKRNIPDVALTADNIYVCYNNGNTGGSSYFMGTSVAAPLWAGFTALVNQQAAMSGQVNGLGLLNPALYALATNANYSTLFHDITTGNNIGTNTANLYYATTGYDLCTGLGTPNGVSLINALAPPAFFVAVTNAGWSLLAESATPANSAIDPGETVTVSFTLQNTGTVATSNLVATLLPGVNVLAPSAPQTYGAIAGYGGTAGQSFTFTAAGGCGSNIIATLQLQDGTNNLGLVSFGLPLGALASFPSFAQNFDGVARPALPSGWSSVNLTGTANHWATTNDLYDTAPNSVFISDLASTSENALVSPVIPIVSANAQLTFRQNYSFDYHSNSSHKYRDGGVLEIQIGSGGFADIVTAGGSFAAGGYNNTINTVNNNPLNGRSAWVGSSSGWQTVVVNLPPSAAGQNIQLRWNCGSDSSNSGGTGAVGWHVDSLSITDAVPNCLSVFADVAAGQSVAADSLQADQNLVYLLSVTNFGPQPAANVMLTDAVPANATFVSASPSCVYSPGQVVCPAGMLAPNASTNFIVTFAPAGGNVFTNLVTAGTVTPDSNAANNSSTLVSTQSAPAPAGIASGPGSQTIQCGSSAAFSITVTGTPPLNIQWSLDGAPLAAATNTSLTLTNVHLPSHVVAVVVTNLYGSTTSSAPLTVEDTLAPVISLNSTNPFYVELGGTYTDPGATAYDLCAGVVPVTTNGVVNPGAVSTNTVTYTAADGSGNTNSVARIVIVRDTTSPAISWSFTNLALTADSNCVAAMPDVTGTNYVLATDLSEPLTITQNPTNRADLPVGTNLVLITVADAYGNQSYSTNWIAVRDIAPPVIVLNGSDPMTNELGVAFADPGVTASDDCSGIAMLTTNGTINVNVVGVNLLDYTAVDGSGNTNSVTRIVIVRDTTPPTILWSFTNLVLAANTNCGVAMPDVTGTNFILATDLSEPPAFSQTPTNGAILPLGTNIVVIAVSDIYSNTAYSINTVIVQDQTPPVFITQPQSQTNLVRTTADFSAAATACTPATYQWIFNNAILTGQTNGALTLSNVNFTAAGNYFVVATASGGSTTSAVATLTVNLNSTSLALNSPDNPSGYRDDLNFTAAVTPTNAGGTVQFFTNSFAFDTETLVAGEAVSTNLASLPRGTNWITAIYSGDADDSPATNTLAQIVTNHPPAATDVVYSRLAGYSVDIAVADLATNWSDPDGDTVSLAGISVSDDGVTVTNDAGTLIYFDTNNVDDEFICAISDGWGGTNYQTVYIDIVLTNTIPTIIGVGNNSNGSVTLSLGGAPGETYVLEATTNLISPFGWQPLSTNRLGTNGLWQFTDPQVMDFPQRFYRLKLAP